MPDFIVCVCVLCVRMCVLVLVLDSLLNKKFKRIELKLLVAYRELYPFWRNSYHMNCVLYELQDCTKRTVFTAPWKAVRPMRPEIVRLSTLATFKWSSNLTQAKVSIMCNCHVNHQITFRRIILVTTRITAIIITALHKIWACWCWFRWKQCRWRSSCWCRRWDNSSRTGGSCCCSCYRSWIRRSIRWSIRSRRWSWSKVEFPFQKLGSPSCVPPLGRRAWPLLCLDQSGFHITFLGIKGKGKCRVDGEGETEVLALAGQRLAEGQALRCQGRVHCTQQISSHFHLFFWIWKIAGWQWCMLLFSLLNSYRRPIRLILFAKKALHI